MKRLIITLALCCTTLCCFAKKEYCSARMTLTSEGDYEIFVSYGLLKHGPQPKKHVLTLVDMLNVMAEMGWELVPSTGTKEYIFVREVEQ